jgi:hypothetical protein
MDHSVWVGSRVTDVDVEVPVVGVGSPPLTVELDADDRGEVGRVGTSPSPQVEQRGGGPNDGGFGWQGTP